MEMIVTENTEIILNNQIYLLEEGDTIILEKEIDDREVEYPVNDKEHTQSAIGYIMKYKNRKDKSGQKARRNKSKVAKAAKRFGIELPENW